MVSVLSFSCSIHGQCAIIMLCNIAQGLVQGPEPSLCLGCCSGGVCLMNESAAASSDPDASLGLSFS
ncbi:hypothetical protein EJB05_10155, partial [Eragrostis curvula]